MWEKEIAELKRYLQISKHVVFFGGAGVSTGSGIPDFRGPNGVYSQPSKTDEAPEYLLSHTCLRREPEKFYRFYRSDMLYPEAQPNKAHLALAEMEKRGLLHAVVTQNIDGLHQAAGSRKVFELHGSTKRYYCADCGRSYESDAVEKTSGIPHCDVCGGMIRPDVVLYEEGLDDHVFSGAEREIAHADLLIVGGTSLLVYPAAGLVDYFFGKHLAIINLSPTPYDAKADILIRASLDEVLPALLLP